jgi:hypothetical protein
MADVIEIDDSDDEEDDDGQPGTNGVRYLNSKSPEIVVAYAIARYDKDDKSLEITTTGNRKIVQPPASMTPATLILNARHLLTFAEQRRYIAYVSTAMKTGHVTKITMDLGVRKQAIECAVHAMMYVFRTVAHIDFYHPTWNCADCTHLSCISMDNRREEICHPSHAHCNWCEAVRAMQKKMLHAEFNKSAYLRDLYPDIHRYEYFSATGYPLFKLSRLLNSQNASHLTEAASRIISLSIANTDLSDNLSLILDMMRRFEAREKPIKKLRLWNCDLTGGDEEKK